MMNEICDACGLEASSVASYQHAANCLLHLCPLCLPGSRLFPHIVYVNVTVTGAQRNLTAGKLVKSQLVESSR